MRTVKRYGLYGNKIFEGVCGTCKSVITDDIAPDDVDNLPIIICNDEAQVFITCPVCNEGMCIYATEKTSG